MGCRDVIHNVSRRLRKKRTLQNLCNRLLVLHHISYEWVPGVRASRVANTTRERDAPTTNVLPLRINVVEYKKSGAIRKKPTVKVG